MFKRESIKRGSITTSILNVAGKLAGFLSLFLIAYFFGADGETDVYYFMLSFTALLSTVLTSLQTSVFLPLFIKTQEQLGKQKAWDFLNSLFTYTLLAAVVFCCLFFAFYDSVILAVSEFPIEIINASGTIIVWFTPVMLLMILIEFLRTVLYAHHQFTFPAITVFFNGVLMILLLLIFGRTVGMKVLVLSLFCSYTLQFLLLLSYIKKNEPLFKLNFKSVEQHLEFLKLGLPIFLTQAFGAFSMFFYDYSATMFAAGTLTALAFANKIATLPNEMIITPISQVVSPLFSENVAKNEHAQLANNYFRFNNIIWLFIIPVSFFLIFFSAPVVEILFKRGNFSEQDAHIAGTALKLSAIGIFGYSLNAISSRAYLALQKTFWISISSLIISILSILITFILVKELDYIGVPLSRTVSVAVLSTAACILFSTLYIPDFRLKMLLYPFLKLSASAAVAGGISFILYQYLADILVLNANKILLTISLAISALCYAACYILLCWALKIRELEHLFDLAKRIRSRVNFRAINF